MSPPSVAIQSKCDGHQVERRASPPGHRAARWCTAVLTNAPCTLSESLALQRQPADPYAIRVHPRVDKSISPHVSFALFNPFFPKDAGCYRHISDHTHADRLRFRLLLIHWLRHVDARQK